MPAVRSPTGLRTVEHLRAKVLIGRLVGSQQDEKLLVAGVDELSLLAHGSDYGRLAVLAGGGHEALTKVLVRTEDPLLLSRTMAALTSLATDDNSRNQQLSAMRYAHSLLVGAQERSITRPPLSDKVLLEAALLLASVARAPEPRVLLEHLGLRGIAQWALEHRKHGILAALSDILPINSRAASCQTSVLQVQSTNSELPSPSFTYTPTCHTYTNDRSHDPLIGYVLSAPHITFSDTRHPRVKDHSALFSNLGLSVSSPEVNEPLEANDVDEQQEACPADDKERIHSSLYQSYSSRGFVVHMPTQKSAGEMRQMDRLSWQMTWGIADQIPQLVFHSIPSKGEVMQAMQIAHKQWASGNVSGEVETVPYFAPANLTSLYDLLASTCEDGKNGVGQRQEESEGGLEAHQTASSPQKPVHDRISAVSTGTASLDFMTSDDGKVRREMMSRGNMPSSPSAPAPAIQAHSGPSTTSSHIATTVRLAPPLMSQHQSNSQAHHPNLTGADTEAFGLCQSLLDTLLENRATPALPVRDHAQRLPSGARGISLSCLRALRGWYRAQGTVDRGMGDVGSEVGFVASIIELTRSTGLSLMESLVLAAGERRVKRRDVGALVGMATSFFCSSWSDMQAAAVAKAKVAKAEAKAATAAEAKAKTAGEEAVLKVAAEAATRAAEDVNAAKAAVRATDEEVGDMLDAIERTISPLELADGRTRYVWVDIFCASQTLLAGAFRGPAISKEADSARYAAREEDTEHILDALDAVDELLLYFSPLTRVCQAPHDACLQMGRGDLPADWPLSGPGSMTSASCLVEVSGMHV